MLDVEPRALDRPPASAGNVVFAPPDLGPTAVGASSTNLASPSSSSRPSQLAGSQLAGSQSPGSESAGSRSARTGALATRKAGVPATASDNSGPLHNNYHPAWNPAHSIRRSARNAAIPSLALHSPLAGFPGVVKRGLDIVIATVGLIVGAIPMLAIALLIRLDSPGAPVFRQTRIGINGTRFALWKFRTMRHDACQEPGFRQATRRDPRITRFGAWLRRTSLDELPQLLNVLTGDMSMVGPRPHAPGTRAGHRLFEDVTHRYAARHQIRPGMTGLAQIRGWRGETDTEEKLLLRIESDLEYIANWSLALDLKIIWRTARCLLRMRNAY